MIDIEINKQLKEEYNPDGSSLRKLQLKELEILKVIHSICLKHNIHYWISSGTLLGAVRHGGFIPWDDDIDVEMFSSDYKKFAKVAKKELENSAFAFQDHYTDSEYIHHFGKVRDLKSRIIVNNPTSENYKFQGVFVDVFFIEPSNTEIIRKIAGYIQNRTLAKFYKIQNKYIRKMMNHLFWYGYEFILFPVLRLSDKINSKGHYRLSMGFPFYHKRFEKDLRETIDVNFEGYMFKAPKGWDSYLKQIYGNYMNIPPKDKRKIHTLEIMDV